MFNQKPTPLPDAQAAPLNPAPLAGTSSSSKREDKFATLRVDDLQIYTNPAKNPKVASPNITQIPGFEILDVLGAGSTGIVFKARHLALKRLVALKMIACDHFGSTARGRFEAEAQTIARLHHPNFVQIFEFGEYEGRPYLVLELVEGGTLRELLTIFRPMPVREAVQLVALLARAMHFAHEKGVVHRDLKPANILLASGGAVSGEWSGATVSTHNSLLTAHYPKITDFGLAKVLDAAQARTRSGAVVGTPAYMAPEQALGRVGAIGPATDVYALGVILYEMLVGRAPFDGANCWDILVHIVEDDPAPPSSLRPRLAHDLNTICLKALAKDPSRRYASAADLAADLERFADGENIEARPDRAWQRVTRRLRKRPFLLAAGVFLTGMLAFLAVLLVQERGEAQAALRDGRQLRQEGNWSAAMVQLKLGQQSIGPWPGSENLKRELNQELRRAKAGQWGAELHVLADRVRFHQDAGSFAPEQKQQLRRQCREIFDARANILELRDAADAAWEMQVVRDLFDVAQLGSRLEQVQPEATIDEIAALRITEDLEHAGANPAVLAELKDTASGTAADQPGERPLRTAWRHYVAGRTLRITGDISAAAKRLDQAIAMDPRLPVFHFEAGVCASRQRQYLKAQQLLTTCIALVLVTQPASHRELDVCYFNRGLANVALEQPEFAEADFTQALTLNPSLGEAWFQRGLLARAHREFHAAADDFQQTLTKGFAQGRVHYELARLCREQGDSSAALKHAESARLFADCPPDCEQLEQDLRKECQQQRPSGQ
jgi:eukaryotic-like serine/threonine-protein kinase